MSFSELVTAVAERAQVPKTVVRHVLLQFIEEAKKVPLSGERVILPGFGTFVHHDLSHRPVFGGRRKVTARRIVRFRQSRRA